MENELRVFACDHRNLNGKPWNYPFERLGTGFSNDCRLKDIVEPTICNEHTNRFFSDYTAIWWLWKHLDELHVSKFIGFLHYRRFFTVAKPNFGKYPLLVVNADPSSDVVKQVIPDTAMLLNALKSKALDGILPATFPDYIYAKKCMNVVDLMFEESNAYKLGFDKLSCQMMFGILDKNMAKWFSKDIIDAVHQQLNTFHFNIFILDLELFDIYNQILESTILECDKQLASMPLDLVPRALSYAIERFSSNVFLAMAMSGKKFGSLPLMVVENKEEVL